MAAKNQAVKSTARVPRATYRLQFNEHFKLRDGFALVPYLKELGVSHIYASPLFAATAHSQHGYDVCDFTRLNPELGTEADLRELVSALKENGMGLVLDIVPNHMGVGTMENKWWWDVLTHGQASEFANYFDIDWSPSNPRLTGKVLVPVLGEAYERVLKRGELQLAEDSGGFVLQYYKQRFPIAPRSLPVELAGKSTEAFLQEFNANMKALDELIQQQHYLLADWHDADSQLNYRRFFNIATLAGLRMEDANVFDQTHALLRRWVKEGLVEGLRVDHPDGLRDPGEYLRRLRGIAPDAWIIVEKILEPGEDLPSSWPISGTTGYDFLNRVGGLFIDPSGEQPMTDFYTEFTCERADFAGLVLEQKRQVLRDLLAAEVSRLVELLRRITAKCGQSQNFSRETLREAVIELAASLPDYRTYLRPQQSAPAESEIALVDRIITLASRRRTDLGREVFYFLSDVLLLIQHGDLETDFVLRFQQLTCSTMAKGVEDTIFYRFNRLAALNEVGGDPGKFGIARESFDQACTEANRRWPNTMLSTSTHDTKRSEDVRARLWLLSEIPEEWNKAVRKWSAMNECHRTDRWPDRNIECLYYQMLVGAWLISEERILEFVKKAACEAKQHTTCGRPNKDYEAALMKFVSSTFRDDAFRRDIEQFATRLVEAGYVNSLAQTLVKLTAPGVPDIYQGCDLWDFSLVDPDNRRPVDFALRQKLMTGMKTLSIQEIWKRRDEGLPKLFLIQRTLGVRALHPDWFAGTAAYESMKAQGARANHVVSFSRGNRVITVVPRLILGLANEWSDTTIEIPHGEWRNEFSGDILKGGLINVASLLKHFPVALLTKTPEEHP